MIEIAVIGAAGRMGKMLLTLIDAHEQFKLAGAIVMPDSAEVGVAVNTLMPQLSSSLKMSDRLSDLPDTVEVLIDFSTPSMVLDTLAYCAQHQKAAVIGVTGLSERQVADLEKFAHQVPFVFSANMSLGVNLMQALVEKAAQALGSADYDIEIIESHHRHKVDAPSGTALMLGEAAAKGLNVALSQCAVFARHEQRQARQNGEIGFSSIRGGDIAGEHTVMFATSGERLEITHRATNRLIFAQGALKACQWIVQQTPGRYNMRNVLGLD